MDLRTRVTQITASTSGALYDANFEPRVLEAIDECADLCWEYNQLRPSDREARSDLARKILGSCGSHLNLVPPFYADYGKNIHVGERFFANRGCYFLDGAPITMGDDVYIAPYCVFSTAGHPIDADLRNQGLEYALPITVGSNVWFGMNVSVCPGVTIGSNVVIGAGSTVVKDIPSNVVAVGNPCRPIRPITEADAEGAVLFEPPTDW